jgi:DNA-binding transcriptional LysR family regulator
MALSGRTLDRLKVRHLRLLALVDEFGSLSAAAAALGLTQPAATRMLHELEAAFGAQLVVRQARGARLSDAGLAARERLRQTLASLEVALAATGGRAPIPLLRLGILPLASVTLLPAALARLRAGPAPPRVIISESTVPVMLDALNERRIDCAVGRFEVAALQGRSPGDLAVVPLVEDRLAYVAAPRHRLARRGLTLARMAAASWVLPGQGSFTRRAIDQQFLQHGLPPPEAAVESPSFHTSLSIVAATDLIGIAPMSAVQRYESLGLVRRLPLAAEVAPGKVAFLALRESLALPSVAALRDALLAGLADLAA